MMAAGTIGSSDRIGQASSQPRRTDVGGIALWWSILPLMLLLHPYRGLLQDARIYVGRGVADLDRAGIGRDIMFAHDGQTGYSLMHGLVAISLSLTGYGEAALALALMGGMLWLASAVALARSLASGRAAWAAAVCIVALPTRYGAFDIFNSAETLATPRVFAQAAVMSGLAAVTARRPRLGAGLLLVAAAFHPLIALPGLGIGIVLLLRAPRRWLVFAALGGAGIVVSGVLGLPLANRLFQPMDGTWLEILRTRSTYLFPSLWPDTAFGPIVCQATASVAAAAFAPRPVRSLLLASLTVAMAGVVVSWFFGDLHPSVLIVQVQPWRALWLLAVLGNAGFALAMVALWSRGEPGRIGAAMLTVTWLSFEHLPLAAGSAMITLFLVAKLRRGSGLTLPRPVELALAALVIGGALVNMLSSGMSALVLLRSVGTGVVGPLWPMVVSLGVQTVPLVLGALVVACRSPSPRRSRPLRLGAAVTVACATAAAAWLWDARSADRRFIEAGQGDAALNQAIGPGRGEVLWIDEDSQTWFLARRPSFMNSAQAGPILFSRDLAMEWWERSRRLLTLGLLRPDAVAPWSTLTRNAQALPLRPEAVEAFCTDPRHPAALVAPGDQRQAVPLIFHSGLWTSPHPMNRMVSDEDDLHWQTMTIFTVVQCPAAVPDAEKATSKVGDD